PSTGTSGGCARWRSAPTACWRRREGTKGRSSSGTWISDAARRLRRRRRRRGELFRQAGEGRVCGQLDHFAVAVEVGAEKLEEAGVAQEGPAQGGRGESGPPLPLALLEIVSDTESHLRVTERSELGGDAAGRPDRGVGQVDAELGSQRIR